MRSFLIYPSLVYLSLVVFVGGCSRGEGIDYAKLAGLPVYPGAVAQPGAAVERKDGGTYVVAIFKSGDGFRPVYRWYVAHMPGDARSAISRTRDAATLAVFDDRDRRTVHIEAGPGATIIELSRSSR